MNFFKTETEYLNLDNVTNISPMPTGTTVVRFIDGCTINLNPKDSSTLLEHIDSCVIWPNAGTTTPKPRKKKA